MLGPTQLTQLIRGVVGRWVRQERERERARDTRKRGREQTRRRNRSRERVERAELVFAYACICLNNSCILSKWLLVGTWRNPGHATTSWLSLDGIQSAWWLFVVVVVTVDVVVVVVRSRIITLTRLLRPLYELLKKCWPHVAVSKAQLRKGIAVALAALCFFTACLCLVFFFIFFWFWCLCCRSFYLFL